MKKSDKRDNPEYMGVKQVFGVTALSTTSSITAIFMTTMFMTFMTDYAGLGAWGATLATSLLLFARILDAVDDPIQSIIMDNAKIGKSGKYKPFFLISIFMTAIGAIALYALPDPITQSPVLVSVWVILFYLVYDIGTSFYNQNIMYRAMTIDVKERAKLAFGPAMFVLLLGVLSSGLMTAVVQISNMVGSYKTAYGLMVAASCLLSVVISVIGWLCIEERHVTEHDEEEKASLKDFVSLLKINKAMVVHVLKCVFSGFVWTLLFATPTYYIKWAFCTNLATGEVDMQLLATYSIISTIMMLFPTLIGNILGRPLLKLFKGDPIRTGQFNMAVEAVFGLALFISQVTGLLERFPAFFFICFFMIALAVASDSIPQATVEMEVMDYTIYKTGKDQSAMTGVFSRFLSKAQSALSSALVGAILIAIGYNVDSVTGNYAGDVANIPTMLNWFIVIMGLVPAILAIIAIFIYQKYPLNNTERAQMRAALDKLEVHGGAEEKDNNSTEEQLDSEAQGTSETLSEE